MGRDGNQETLYNVVNINHPRSIEVSVSRGKCPDQDDTYFIPKGYMDYRNPKLYLKIS